MSNRHLYPLMTFLIALNVAGAVINARNGQGGYAFLNVCAIGTAFLVIYARMGHD